MNLVRIDKFNIMFSG